MSTQYPGPDPDDPFAKAPDESGATQPPAVPAPTEETAPIQSDQVGYWEKLAQEQGAPGAPPPPPPTYEQNPTTAQPEQSNPWAGYGEPAGPGATPAPGPTPPPPANPYGAPTPYTVPASPYTYGATGYTQPANHPQATTALVLGLIGLVGGCLCGLPLIVSPFAWVIGARAKKEIAASNGQLGGQGNAQAGYVTGIIGSVLLVLGILLIGFFVVLGVTGHLDEGSGYSSTNF